LIILAAILKLCSNIYSVRYCRIWLDCFCYWLSVIHIFQTR